MAASIPLVSPNTPPRQIAALLLLSAIAYWPAWQSFFVKDDLTLITSADLDLAAALQHAWPGGFFRPAGELVFAIQHQFFGLYPLPYHLMSFIAHSAAVLFAYHLFRLFPHYRAIALWAAVLFAIHPLNTETVSWISGQLSLYATLCALATLYLLATSRPLFALLPVFLLGLGFYENFLLVIPLAAVCYWGLQRPRMRLRPLHLIVLGCCALIYLYWRFVGLGLSGGNYQASLSFKSAIVNLAYYLYLLAGGSAIGGRIIHYRPAEIGDHFFAVLTPLLLLNIIIILLYLLYLRREKSSSPARLLLPLCWIIIALLPVLILPERPRRLSYLAVPGFALAMGQILYYLQKKIRPGSFLAKAGIAVYILVLVSTLHLRNRDWQQAGTLEHFLPAAIEPTCRQVAFDVPNLLGDALFFSNISTAQWIQLSGADAPTVYTALELLDQQQQIAPGCYYRYDNGIIRAKTIATQQSIIFSRGRNWAQTH